MFVRKKKNRSGTTSVVVVDKRGGKFKELSTIGIGHNDEELHSETYSFFQRLPNKSIDCNTGFLG